MNISPSGYPFVKLNVRLREFFVDFLACLIPGYVFLVTSSLVVFLFLLDVALYVNPTPSFSFAVFEKFNAFRGMWGFVFFFIGTIFISYIAGHLLYRQDPKKPDYHSFIKNREKVMSYNQWVISVRDGLIPDDIQFPYSNLKEYLDNRNAKHLGKEIKWTSRINGDEGDKSRSKSLINQLKTRIAFFHPESTLNIIKNEAHIRLASSMWYVAEYLLLIFYYIFPIYILFLIYKTYSSLLIVPITFFISSLIPLLIGVSKKNKSKKIISKEVDNRSKPNNLPTDEDEIKKLTKQIGNNYKLFDMIPFISSLMCLIGVLLAHTEGSGMIQNNLMYSLIYSFLLVIIYLGVKFLKYRINDSFHYQRVREIIFVLETAHLACVLSDDDLDKLRKASLASFKQFSCPIGNTQ